MQNDTKLQLPLLKENPGEEAKAEEIALLRLLPSCSLEGRLGFLVA